MARAGHRSMSTTKGYLHLAGVVFRDEADALERRLLGTVNEFDSGADVGTPLYSTERPHQTEGQRGSDAPSATRGADVLPLPAASAR
jgi:hypothetical protein